jgi:hypothetical protein
MYENTTAPWPPVQEGRPTFLTVLCVLIFIFCGWSALSNFMEAASPPDPELVEQQIEESMERFGSFGGGADTEEVMDMVREVTMQMVEKARPIAILKGLAALLAIAGAWLMWNLRRQGFHLYVVAGIIWAFAPMFFIGGNMVTWISAVIYGFVVLVFSIMFALNLKYMQ